MTARALVVAALAWVLAAVPAGAQITTSPTSPPTTPPPTSPPTTDPPVTEPPTTAAPMPTTTRARSTTTRSSTSVATTTTQTLLPPPSVAPQDPELSPPGSEQSDRLSAAFVWLSILGFVTGIGILVSQWFLTRPGRRGWTF